MKTLTFDVYCDPGHAWVKVSKKQLVRFFGDHWRKSFSSCSHERGDHVYLEEDQDAATWVQRLRDNQVHPVWREHSSSKLSRIRNYPYLSAI